MALDPSVIGPSPALLQSLANPVNPLDIQTKRQALQNQQMQQQVLQQSLASGQTQQQLQQTELQQRQLELQGQQAAMQSYQASGGDPDKAAADLQSKGWYNQSFALKQQGNALKQAINQQQAATDTHQNAVDQHNAQRSKYLADMAQSVLSVPEGPGRAIAYNSAFQHYVTLYPELAKDPGMPAQYAPELEPQLKALANYGKTPADIAKQDLEEMQAKTQINALKTLQQNPQAGGQIINQVFPPELDPGMNKSFVASYNNALATSGLGAALNVVKDATDKAAEIRKATNPAIQQAEVNKARETARVTMPFHVQEQVQAEIQKAKMAPGEFSSVIDPASRNKAIMDFENSSKEYADKMGSAMQMQDFVKQAQAGNKAVPGLLGIAELRTIVNRVTNSELDSVSKGAGNAKDRLIGWWEHNVDTGNPIPPDIMRDMNTVSAVQAQVAQRNYENKVQMNRQIYGSKAQPIQLPNMPATGAPGTSAVPANVQSALKSVGPGIHTLSDGSKWMKAGDGTITKQ